MEVQAILKNFRMSPQKVREVVRQVQGLRAVDALAVLKVVPRKSARAVAKTLASAIANAENNHGLKADSLIVHRAYARSTLSAPPIAAASPSSLLALVL